MNSWISLTFFSSPATFEIGKTTDLNVLINSRIHINNIHEIKVFTEYSSFAK